MQTELFRQHQEDGQVHSVSEITKEIRKSLECKYLQVWIRGEISNLRAHSSGHRYFLLKDATAQMKAVLFRGDAHGLSYLPEEGDECLAFGDITVYEPRGEYQLRVRHLMQDGLGNLRMQFERLKEKLLKEGLFDQERKRSLPIMAKKIALVTSLGGAVLHDFITILKRRGWKGEVLIFGSSVQGKEAPLDLIRALSKAQSFPEVELIVLARGGGSIEDLWAFNDERLIRFLAECPKPTISAIGHQTDFTLSDFVADFRSETPSAAAEWISSQFIRVSERLENLKKQIHELPKKAIAVSFDRLKLCEARLAASSPLALMQRQNQFLDDLETRIQSTTRNRLERASDSLQFLDKRLQGCSLESSLLKGFSYFKDEKGRIIDSAKKLADGQKVSAQFKDGVRNMKVEK